MKVINNEQLSIAVECLKRGKVLVFPTETSYGLGCDATNQEAVDKIFKIKERKKGKSLLVVVPTVEMGKKYLVWNNLLEKLANKYWPGPLTVVGRAQPNCGLASGVVSAEGTLALRVTNHPIPKFLSESLGKPLVATSANIAAAGDMYNAQEIAKLFENKENKPDLILDYGTLPKNLPSTIVSAVDDELKIIRQGDLLIKDI